MAVHSRVGHHRSRPLRILGLSPYPAEAAGTRFRLLQFQGPLRRNGIELLNVSMLNSNAYRSFYARTHFWSNIVAAVRGAIFQLLAIIRSAPIDAVFVRREAMVGGPPIAEWLATTLHRCPLVLDLDDATYIAYNSPTYGRLGRILKWPGKTESLVRRSSLVICGNPVVRDHVSALGAATVLIPTVVDTTVYRPQPNRTSRPAKLTLGWIGSHSTYPYLASIFPALQAVARRHAFTFLVVGSGRQSIDIPGVEVEVRDWDLDREVEDFQSLDIGVYPVGADSWAEGKSGFKAVQYMAVGIPYVASPVGILAQMGDAGVTHLNAGNLTEWEQALDRLLGDAALRERMGRAGREHCLANYNLDVATGHFAAALKSLVGRQ